MAIGERKLIALADRGYFEGYEILKCGQAGIAALVPKPMTSNSLAEGRVLAIRCPTKVTHDSRLAGKQRTSIPGWRAMLQP